MSTLQKLDLILSNSENNKQKSEKVNLRKKEVLIDGTYYDVTKWSNFHPGGKVINYYTESGEDATIPFLQFHNRSMKRVLFYRNMLPLRESQENKTSSEQKQKQMTEGLKSLHSEFQARGLFNPSWSHVITRVAEFFLYLLLSRLILQQVGVEWSSDCHLATYLCRRAFGILMLATAYWRIVWLAHEGGHYSLTGRPKMDLYLQKFLYGFGNGLSASWWNHNHSKHHAMPQRIHRDVDLDTLPLIAFTSKVFKSSKYMDSFFIKYQAILFLPLHTFLVTLRWHLDLHPRYCYYKRQYFELFCISLHFIFAVTQIGVINFLIAKWLWSIYMFGNFSLSHTHLPVAEGPKHWAEYALINTVNIEPGLFIDWWMGYLNFQIEHHLFPTMPQFRHPLIKDRVRKFAEDNGLTYKVMGYWEAVGVTLKNLQTVSQQVCGNISNGESKNGK